MIHNQGPSSLKSNTSLGADIQDSTDSLSTISSTNLFRSYFKKIHRPGDLQLIVVSVIRLLRTPIDADISYLPGYTKNLNFTNELLIFLWLLMTTSSLFLEYLCKSPKVLDLVQVLMVNLRLKIGC
jgi:hypothetical protein